MPHTLCGDQHLAVTVRHGIDDYRDGPYAFTAPAIVNTIYGGGGILRRRKSEVGRLLAAPING